MSKPETLPNNIHYPLGAAPFGELTLSRRRGSHEGVSTLSRRAQQGAEVVVGSWLGSAWLHEAIGDEAYEDLQGAAHPVLAQVKHNMRSALVSYGFNGGMSPDLRIGWLALESVGRLMPPDRVVGVALAREDVSGSLATRAYKRRYHPEKVYACVEDIAVGPIINQRRGIGTALFDASLRCFDPDQVPTTYILGNQPALVTRLAGLGYKETGSHLRPDLLGPDLPALTETRLQAGSVGEVRENLRRPDYASWLDHADVEMGPLDI